MRFPAVFVDSSAWVALFSKADTLHTAAKREWRALGEQRRKMVTTDYVLDESYTLLRREPNGLALAIAFRDTITHSKIIEVVDADPYLHQDAWHLFTLFDENPVSYTDCVSFAVMRREGLVEAFTFDGDFARAGLLMRPGKRKGR